MARMFDREVQAAIVRVGARASIAADTTSADLFSALRAKFGAGKGGQLWEALAEKTSCWYREAWRWIAEYLDRESILFFAPGSAVFELSDGVELVDVIGECSCFEFYVTDRALSFVLCFNDHDFLIASGDARSWLDRRIARGT